MFIYISKLCKTFIVSCGMNDYTKGGLSLVVRKGKSR